MICLWNSTGFSILELNSSAYQAGICLQTNDVYLTDKIMFKKLFISACLVSGAMTLKADEGQKINSKVQKVAVFLSGAQVTRTATVTIKPGQSTLIFDNISPDIDVQSIQVHAAGEFTILSVKQELSFLNEQAKQKRIEDLRNEQKALKDKIDLQTDLLSVYKEQEEMLVKNQVVTGNQSNLDIVKLKQALDFHVAELSDIKKKEQTQTQQIAALTIELQKYNRQIADAAKGESNITSNILVNISSASATQSQFTLSYVVRNAGWFPTYDIRAKNVNSPIAISYKANVSQHCGEDWKDVKLTLSTGNPTVSGSKPMINPYYLNFGMYYANDAANITRVSGKVMDEMGEALPGVTIKVKGTSIGTVTDASGNYTLQVPPVGPTIVFSFIGYETMERPAINGMMNISLKPSAKMLNEVVVIGYGVSGGDYNNSGYVSYDKLKKAEPTTIPIAVTQNENQTNFEFNIENPYSVPSDGKQYTVEISTLNLDASYEYSVAPKLSTDVFLTARLTDWNKYNFLSGEASLFFEGTYIGKSLIDTHTSADTLSLSLGTDKNIVVTRTLQKNLTERQTFGSNKKETKDWLIEVKNRKSQPVNLLVEDQVPVSQNSSIEVETQELSAGKMAPLTGKVAWSLVLNPQDDKKLELKYQVKYPKNQMVIVQ